LLNVCFGWGEGGEAWKWRRRLLVWEEELVGQCWILLLYVTLQVAISDQWAWSLDPIKRYSVRNVYRILTSDVPRLKVVMSNIV